MVKGLVSGDLHLGVSLWGGINPETGMNRMVEKFIDELDKTATKVIEEKYDVWVINGDIFHTRTPSNAVREAFARILYKVLSNGTRVVIVLGNHDIQTTLGAKDSLADIRAMNPDGLYVIDSPTVLPLYFRDTKIVFLCLPWMKDGADVALHAKSLRYAIAEDKSASAVFLLGHFSVEGAVVGAERLFELTDDKAVPFDVLVGDDIDFTFLSHIHKAQKLGEKAAYVGSMERVDFSERNEPKGHMTFSVIGPHQVVVNYVEGTPQKYVQHEIDMVGNSAGVYEPTHDAIYKVKVYCTDEQKKIFDTKMIEPFVKTAKWFMPIVFEVAKTKESHRAKGIARDVRWQDALLTWLERQNVSPEMQEKVVRKSRELFEEVMK